MKMDKCRMCEKEVDWIAKPLDGLCAHCHRSLCQKGLEKCVRCAKILDGIIDDVFGKPKEDG